MTLRTINDVVDYLHKELVINHNENISFTSTVLNIDISDVYSRLFAKAPELILCVDNLSVQLMCLGLWNNYTVSVKYTEVYPSFVKTTDSEQQVKNILIKATKAHRKNEYIVCRSSDSDMVLSAIRSIVALPECLNSFISGVQPAVFKRPESEYIGIVIRLLYNCDYRTAKEREHCSKNEIERIVNVARSAGSEDWRKAYAVLKYCVNSWQYERDSGTGLEYTAYGALVNKKAVCMGFSLALCSIFKELGIPCKYICGLKNNEGHAWNMIFVKGGWFYIDITDAIGAQDPLYNWGTIKFTDGRIISTVHREKLLCNCDKKFVEQNINRR